MTTSKYKGVTWGSRILIFLKILEPPKFKVGDWIKYSRFRYYEQECEILKITSDIMFGQWGYRYDTKSYLGDTYYPAGVYEINAERIEPRFFETPYDPKQMGDKEDDI